MEISDTSGGYYPRRETNLPCHETNSFHNGWLDDLLSREHAPCDGVWTRLSVRSEVTALVDDIVCDIRVPLDMRDQRVEEFGRDEELEVRLGGKMTSALLFRSVLETKYTF